jgi:hypothetical protein
MKMVIIPGAGMIWTLQDGVTPEALGFLVTFWNVHDQRSAQEQADANYGMGSFDVGKSTLHGSRETTYELHYPEDPPLLEMARTELRDELIVLFEAEFVAIIQPDDSFVRCHMD